MIAEVNDGGGHHVEALLPLPALGGTFLVAGWRHFDNAEAVERFDVDILRRNVHPANVVAVAVANESGGEIVHPVRVGLAKAGPFVTRALSEAFQVDKFVIDE